ncbi:uncharacterized protein LOC135808562 [Sycon ciliatum]|uniref:uncharacterized protein LOC135808562 n=1 Tax=Sycon ciliatum TaxID=27933 RepID=UPI0031F6A0BE
MMRVTVLTSILLCLLVLGTVTESHRSRSKGKSRLRHKFLLKILLKKLIPPRPRSCITAFGCFRNQCCVRQIDTAEDETSVTFDKRGRCAPAAKFLNEEKFSINRIDDNLNAAEDRVAELSAQSIGEDLLLICRPGSLGPLSEEDIQVSKRHASNRAPQVDAVSVVPATEGPDVATVRDVEDDVAVDDDMDSVPDDDMPDDMGGDTGSDPPGGDNGDGPGGDMGGGPGGDSGGGPDGDMGDVPGGDTGGGPGGDMGDGPGGDTGDGGPPAQPMDLRSPSQYAEKMGMFRERAQEAEEILQNLLDGIGDIDED